MPYRLVSFSFGLLTFLALTPAGLGQCETQILTPSDAEDLDVFGWAVDISGDLAVLGAIGGDDACPMDPNCNSGAAYVFTRTASGWVEGDKLTASDAATGDQFGHDVSISGDRILVGAHMKGAGAAYVFLKTANGWVEEQKLTGSDSQTNFHFGHSVALFGDTALVGVMRDDHAGTMSGAAFIFERVAAGWVEVAKLTAGNTATKDLFGRSCDLYGDVAIIGSYRHDQVGASSGAAYIFERDDQGTPSDPLDDTWDELQLFPSDAAADDWFGRSVGVYQDTVIVGASRNQVGGVATGTAYIFERMGTNWVEMQMLAASDGEDDDRFGVSVSLRGDHAIIGARQDDDGGSDAGAAYVFEKTPSGWVETGKIVASDAAAGDRLGGEMNVTISGDTAIMSAPLSGNISKLAGEAYIIALPVPIGQNYCGPAVPNSSGQPAEISSMGSDIAACNMLTLRSVQLPPNQFGYFISSETQAFFPNAGNSQGNLCLGGKVGRHRKQIQSSGPSGTFSIDVDLTDMPLNPPQSVMAGETWNFQAWFRDVPGTSNFTDAVSITFR